MGDGIRMWRCFWIDFGERGEVRETGILEIEDDKVRTGPPLAMKFILAGLKPPPENSVYYASSARRFWSEICGKTLTLDIKREAKNALTTSCCGRASYASMKVAKCERSLPIKTTY